MISNGRDTRIGMGDPAPMSTNDTGSPVPGWCEYCGTPTEGTICDDCKKTGRHRKVLKKWENKDVV